MKNTLNTMNITQRLAEITPRAKLRVSEVERLIRIHRIIVPPLSRRAILMLCEDRVLETAPRSAARSTYLIYEDSFLEWVKGLDRPEDDK